MRCTAKTLICFFVDNLWLEKEKCIEREKLCPCVSLFSQNNCCSVDWTVQSMNSIVSWDRSIQLTPGTPVYGSKSWPGPTCGLIFLCYEIMAALCLPHYLGASICLQLIVLMHFNHPQLYILWNRWLIVCRFFWFFFKWVCVCVCERERESGRERLKRLYLQLLQQESTVLSVFFTF